MSKLVKLINGLTIEPCSMQIIEIAGVPYVRDGTQFKSASSLGYKPLIEKPCKIAGSTLSYVDDGNCIVQVWTEPAPQPQPTIIEEPIIQPAPMPEPEPIIEEQPQPSEMPPCEEPQPQQPIMEESVNNQETTQPQPIIEEQPLPEQPVIEEQPIIQEETENGNEQQFGQPEPTNQII